ncbi:hypothetical protein PSECIP111951_00988 [Pseudoalteromonas holothuriae]|uniref:Flagellar protein FlaG n=1 Tax=Pseudoalteromonas holothuriae TaxID=2963714 RepID=A0A9W4QWJ3_9GAMM|nr:MULTISPECIES: flagellar protein FlaG [unclassified Pseudoalteromonas]CAH9054227.1 hypothetical protein PSECIP111951_00988 [Pseudoalteromonas sp. CIP111951]CAH9056885.1 hypothetical protein PSECIP111854_01884 [Pseudoalteromonas sp. CIP111854]
MSSSISPTDTNVFEQQRSNLEARNLGEQTNALTKDAKVAKELSQTADKQVDESSKSVGKESEHDKPSLTESFNKLFGENSSISLLQSRSLEFSVGEHEGKTVVKVIDKDNKDVIRQIPSEEFIKMAQRIDNLSDEMQKARGVLLDKQV